MINIELVEKERYKEFKISRKNIFISIYFIIFYGIWYLFATLFLVLSLITLPSLSSFEMLFFTLLMFFLGHVTTFMGIWRAIGVEYIRIYEHEIVIIRKVFFLKMKSRFKRKEIKNFKISNEKHSFFDKYLSLYRINGLIQFDYTWKKRYIGTGISVEQAKEILFMIQN